ncbi:MAG: hypothetical protein ACFCU8_14295 [Thermosynechococcaceae cyanobacterium]
MTPRPTHSLSFPPPTLATLPLPLALPHVPDRHFTSRTPPGEQRMAIEHRQFLCRRHAMVSDRPSAIALLRNTVVCIGGHRWQDS